MKAEQIYQMVTDRVIEKLKEGVCPWVKPWKGGHEMMATNAISKKEYSFLNQMLLGFSGQYLTFNQAKQLGGSIRKGSKSTPVVFWTTGYSTQEEKEDGSKVQVYHEYDRPILKYYNVFHVRDIDGVDFEAPETEIKLSELEPIAEAERVIEEYASRTSLSVNREYRGGVCRLPI